MLIKKIHIITCLFVGLSAIINAAPASNEDEMDQGSDNDQATAQSDQNVQAQDESKDTKDLTSEDDPKLVQAVQEALNALQKQSPIVQEDSLRVWKNFKGSTKPVNYTYRFWGRQLILWLKEEKGLIFQARKDVGAVFKVLYHMNKISANAVFVLTVDVWSHLVYLEGMPDWEKRKENLTPDGNLASNSANKKAPDKSV